jgi:hypothetical protein
MLKIVDAFGSLDWGKSFWRFAFLYFLAPWSGWMASLHMRRDGSPWPLWYRVSHPLANYISLAFQAVMTWLWIRALVSGDWIVVAALPLPAMMNLAVLILRLQTVFRFSTPTDAAER